MKNFSVLILRGFFFAMIACVNANQVAFAQSHPGMAKSRQEISLINVADVQNAVAVAQNGRYTTYSYTFADLIIFSYLDDTQFDVLNASGNVVTSGRLEANSFGVITPGAGTYGVRSTQPFALLIGDPVSRSVLGYFAADERGKGVSTKLLTYMPKDEWGPERFVVFAYKNGTQVQVKNLSTNTVVWSGILNAGGHFISSGLESAFLQVTGSEGVSALSYTDQGYLVPAETGDWVGQRFYGYAGLVGGWPEDLNVISYENGVQIVVKNSQTGSTIWNGTLNKGDLKSLTITSTNLPEVFFDVQATGKVLVSVSPYTAFTADYYHLTGCVDESGTMIGKLFYVPAINSGQLDFSSFEDNNAVTIKRLDTGTPVWSGTLNAGQNVTVSTTRALYEVTGTGALTGVESFGGSFGGEFRPVFYGIDLPDLSVTSSGMSVDPEFAEVGNPVTLRALVKNLGTQTAYLVTAAFYDGDPLQGGKLIGQPYQIAQIASGAQATASVGWTVPANPGYHRIFVVVDEKNAIDESNESNNRAERSFYPNNELEPPLALTIDAPQGLAVDASGNYLPNPFSIRATISNNGTSTCQNIAATLELPNGLVLSSGQSTVNISSLTSGQTSTVTWSVRATSNPVGDLVYRILINSSNCGSKEGKRLIRVPEAPFAADITATWNGQRTDNVDIYVDRGNGFPATPEGKITSVNAPFRVSGLSVGNKLRAVKKVHVKSAAKSGHEAVDDVMFEVWADSDVMNHNGNYSPFEIQARAAVYNLNMTHPVYKYNLVVSAEWDGMDDAYYNQLVTGFKEASAYLYDATDGQAMLNKIAIYDDKDKWLLCDMRIHSEEIRPWAIVEGIDKSNFKFLYRNKIYFGRTWENRLPDQETYFYTIIHEFGHYALGLFDEYKDGNGQDWNHNTGRPSTAPPNFGIMDSQYSTSEFSSANDYLRSYPQELDPTQVNLHYYRLRIPTWDRIKEKLENYFPDADIELPPPGYYPDGPRFDREGPVGQQIELEIKQQTQILDFRKMNLLAANAQSFVSPSNTEIAISYGGTPLVGAHVYARYGHQLTPLGMTDSTGFIGWPGSRPHSQLEILKFLRSGQLRATVPASEIAARLILHLEKNTLEMTSYSAVLQQAGFIFIPTFSIAGDNLTFNLELLADTGLSGAPLVNILYANTTASTNLAASGQNTFTGQLTIDTTTPDFDGTGTFEVSAVTQSGESIKFLSLFSMFFVEQGKFFDAYGRRFDISFSDKSISSDQFGLITESDAQPFAPKGQTLYPVTSMNYVSLERQVRFDGSAGLNIYYTDSAVEGLDETSLAIFKWNVSEKDWEEIPNSKTSLLNNVVSGLIQETGTYIVFAKAASGDVTPPGRIDDLGASTATGQGEVQLQWTAPGDDDFSGIATSYMIRFNEVPISHLNWERSTTISNPPRPVASGSRQAVTVRVPLSNRLYYFAMKARDEAGNESELSNNASAISGIGSEPPDTSNCAQTFSANFDDGNASDFLLNTPSLWAVRQDNGNLALCLDTPNSAGDDYALIRGLTWSDFTLELDARATASSNKNFFILFGAQNTSNANDDSYYLQFALGGVILYRSVGGNGVNVASNPTDFVSSNSRHRIRVERSGDAIRVLVDGTTVLQHSDATFRSGYIGFGSWRSTACFDNVDVNSPGAFRQTFRDDFEDGVADGWTPRNASRWNITSDAGSRRYFLNTTNYNADTGERLGEYSIISGHSFDDFTFQCQAKSWDAAQGSEGADLAVVFGYQDDNNYYYVLYNREATFTALFVVQNGQRRELANYSQGTFRDDRYRTLGVERHGDEIRAFFDGVQIMTARDATFHSGRIGVGSFNDSGYFDDIAIETPGCPPPIPVTISVPGGIKATVADTIEVPVIVSTRELIGVAQFTVEYNDNVIVFVGARVGPDAPGFSLAQANLNPPFAPSTPGTNRNVVVPMAGGGTNSFSGENRTVLLLRFRVVGGANSSSPVAFDRECTRTFLSTTDFRDLCGNALTTLNGSVVVSQLAAISGQVQFYNGNRPVANAVLTLRGATTRSQSSDAAGRYRFDNVNPGNYTLDASKSGDWRNAISGSDAVALLQIIGFVLNPTAGQRIAGDVDRNGSLSGADAVALLRYLAFLPSGTANVGQWRFQPASPSLTVTTDVTQDFTAYLLGDVTGNWNASSMVLAAAAQRFDVAFDDARVTGDSLRLALRVPGDAGTLHSLQASIAWQGTTGATHFRAARPDIVAAVNNSEAGTTHLALATATGVASGELIGELVVPVASSQARTTGMAAAGEVTALVVNDVALHGTELRLAGGGTVPDEFVLLQNYPNPFNIHTSIRFGVPAHGAEDEVVLEIFTLQGQRVRELQREPMSPGYHTVVWDGRDDHGRLVGSGVYLFRLRAGAFRQSSKLLLLK